MSARDHIIDILAQRVEVGDRVAVAASGSYRGARLIVGHVAKFTATRTVVRPEARSGYVWNPDSTSTIDDSLGRVVKIGESA